MGYYPRGFLLAPHCLAENFVVCDRWFASLPGPTWNNRLFAHSGTSLGLCRGAAGASSPPGLHLYNERTLYDELTGRPRAHGASTMGDVPQSLVMTHQFRPPPSITGTIGTNKADVAAGDLPAYCFIEPSYFGPVRE